MLIEYSVYTFEGIGDCVVLFSSLTILGLNVDIISLSVVLGLEIVLKLFELLLFFKL